MNRKPLPNLTIGVFIMSLAVTGYAKTEHLSFVGEAYNDGGDLIYTEHHQLTGACTTGRWRPEYQEVRYFWPEAQTPFAIKKLHYSESLTRPQVSFALADMDTSMTIRANAIDDALDIRWQSGADLIKQFIVPSTPNLVVDAGFDQLVRQRWNELKSGSPVDFRFLAPTRGTDYGFRLDPEASSRLGYPLVVTVRPSGLITRFLVEPITLGYNEAGLLRYYAGLTNIPRNREGENYTAEIRYTETQRPPCPLIP